VLASSRVHVLAPALAAGTHSAGVEVEVLVEAVVHVGAVAPLRAERAHRPRPMPARGRVAPPEATAAAWSSQAAAYHPHPIARCTLMSSPLLDVWEAAAGSPYHATVGKTTQLTAGFVLLFLCMSP
jgi:hypothetical protein